MRAQDQEDAIDIHGKDPRNVSIFLRTHLASNDERLARGWRGPDLQRAPKASEAAHLFQQIARQDGEEAKVVRPGRGDVDGRHSIEFMRQTYTQTKTGTAY